MKFCTIYQIRNLFASLNFKWVVGRLKIALYSHSFRIITFSKLSVIQKNTTYGASILLDLQNRLQYIFSLNMSVRKINPESPSKEAVYAKKF